MKTAQCYPGRCGHVKSKRLPPVPPPCSLDFHWVQGLGGEGHKCMPYVLFWCTNVSPQKPASLSTGTVHMTVSLPSYFPLVATAGFEKYFQTILLPEPLAVRLTLGPGETEGWEATLVATG